MTNGRLLAAAEEQAFDALITVDKNIRFQQNIATRQISLITLNPRLVDLDFLGPMVPELLEILGKGFPPGSQIIIEATPDK